MVGRKQIGSMRRGAILINVARGEVLDQNAVDAVGDILEPVNDLLQKGFLNRSDLVELVIRCPRHPGARLLRPFARSTRGPTRSEFEDAFHAFTECFGLPDALVNATLHGFEVDAYFPEEGVVVELDGWDFHSSQYSFKADREQDAALLERGIVTIRITWDRLIDGPEREARRLRTILEQRRSSYRALIEL